MTERKFNGLLGGIAITAQGDLTFTATDALTEHVLRSTGLEKDIQHNQRVITGIENPKKYVEDINKDLVAIGARLVVIFNQEYSRLLQTGITEEEARKKADEYVEREKERQMRIHKQNFPTEISKKAINSLISKK